MTLMVLVPLAMAAAGPVGAGLENHVNRARELYQGMHFDGALAELSKAKRLVKTPTEQVEVSLYEGVVLANLLRVEESYAAFKTALLLDPSAQLPLEVAPKLSQQFEEIRRQVSSTRAPEMAGQNVVGLQHEDAPAPPHENVVVRPSPVKGPTLRDRAWIPAAAAGALAIASGVTLGMAWGIQKDLLAGCPACSSQQDFASRVSSERTLNTLTAAFGSGAALAAGAAIAMYAFGARSGDGTTVLLSPRGAAVAVRF
jgi:hypothetical protein